MKLTLIAEAPFTPRKKMTYICRVLGREPFLYSDMEENQRFIQAGDRIIFLVYDNGELQVEYCGAKESLGVLHSAMFQEMNDLGNSLANKNTKSEIDPILLKLREFAMKFCQDDEEGKL